MNLHRNILIAILLYATGILEAQIEEYKIYHLTRNSGLSQSTVNCIVRDSTGFMWFGTNDGLNRYDGYQFTHYKHNREDTASISLGRVFTMYLDGRGRLWSGTDQGGLNLYNQDTDNFATYTLLDSTADTDVFMDIRAIDETDAGNLWIATYGLGLWLFNVSDRTFQKVPTPGAEVIRDIQYDFSGNLWLAAENGLFVLEKGIRGEQAGQFKQIDNFNGINLLTLYLNQDGKLWIGTYGEGAFAYDLLSHETEHFSTKETGHRKLNHDIVRCIIRDLDGTMLIGTGGGGINVLDLEEKRMSYLTHRLNYVNSLNTNILYTFYRDANKNLWIGTYNGGVNVVFRHKDKFAHIKSFGGINDLSNNAVLAIEEADDGKLWIGTDGGGLNLFSPEHGDFVQFRHNPRNPNSISGDVVKSLKYDSQDILWIGTFNAGLTAFDVGNNRFQRFYADDNNPASIAENHIWDIDEDTLGNIWIGTLGGGLNCFQLGEDRFKLFRHDPENELSISDDYISSILCDSKGRLWIGTEYGGLNLLQDLNEGTFIRFIRDETDSASISSDQVSSLFEDADGNLWIGTIGGGLNLYVESTETFVHFTEEDGLSNNLVYAILEDDNGDLWITTNDGMSRFTPPWKNQNRPEFRTYSMGDGLQSNEFSPQAACKTSNGMLYFGGINGMNYFDPTAIDSNLFVPPVVLTDLKIFNKSIEIGGPDGILQKHISQTSSIQLSYKHSVITFEFAALDYTMPSQNRYKYMLEGFETDWNEVGNRRTATYTNLDPGKTYTFRVIGSNNDQVWNYNGASVEVYIHPPFWKTWWFRLSIVALLLLGIFLFYRYQLRSLENQREILKQMVDERTYELLDLNKILEQQNREIQYHREELINQKENLEKANLSLEEKQVKIQEQNIELEKHRNNLEELVKQRTAELEEAKRKAEESDMLKTSFLSNMSHEIRTPMNAIVGFASLLGDGDLDLQERDNFVKQIKTNSETLLVLINDILDLSKIESNQLRVDKTDINMDEFIDELFATFKFRDKPRVTLKLTKTFPPDLKISTDPTRLRQVLVNLLENALKFTEQGYVELRVDKQSSWITFWVEDTGIGMSPGVRVRIFDRFYKLERTSEKLYRGTGLGLTITQKLVEILGGKICVESEEGKGSTFRIDLPLA